MPRPARTFLVLTKAFYVFDLNHTDGGTRIYLGGQIRQLTRPVDVIFSLE
jgi:hypothetical protein